MVASLIYTVNVKLSMCVDRDKQWALIVIVYKMTSLGTRRCSGEQ